MADEHHELVIIKRHHGDHDDHHGGVWKIAFADFMTAMMAFFLVMWLIAASNKTRTEVARYFNPVKLVDATVRPPGILDPKTDDASPSPSHDNDNRKTPVDGAAKTPPSLPKETPKSRDARLDATMRVNPFAALAEIAKGQGANETPSPAKASGGTPVIGRAGGTAFRDPFAPPPPQPASADTSDADLLAITPPRPPAQAVAAQAPEPEPKVQSDKPVEKSRLPQKDQDLSRQLMASLKAPGQDSNGPDVAIRKTSEGYLVSLTDTNKFSMFTSGSAVPDRRVVLMMERIAKVIASKPGGVVIRGFTDNKPFKSGRYDNWNLSIDRAQAAHYMLVRGGLSDARIAGVEGFADRTTAPGVDPGSPLNRRIEILLKGNLK